MKCPKRECEAIVQFLRNQSAVRSRRETLHAAHVARVELVRRTRLEPTRAVSAISGRLTENQRKHPLVQELLVIAAGAMLQGASGTSLDDLTTRL